MTLPLRRWMPLCRPPQHGYAPRPVSGLTDRVVPDAGAFPCSGRAWIHSGLLRHPVCLPLRGQCRSLTCFSFDPNCFGHLQLCSKPTDTRRVGQDGSGYTVVFTEDRHNWHL